MGNDIVVIGKPVQQNLINGQVNNPAIKKIKRHSSMKQAITTVVKPKVTHDPLMDADLSIAPDIYAFLMAEAHNGKSNEIAGYGYASAEKEIIWAAICTEGSSGSVDVEAVDENWALLECVKECNAPFNVQLHTHPDFDTFYSGTDEKDISDYIDMVMNISSAGEFYFMVYNFRSMLVRRVVWADGVAKYNNGGVTLLGVQIPRSTSINRGTSYSSYSSYGDLDGEYYGNGYQWNNNVGKKKTVEKEVPTQSSPAKKKGVKESLGTFYRTAITALIDLRKAFEDETSLLSPVRYLTFFDLMEIREYLSHNGNHVVWIALEEEIMSVFSGTDIDDEAEFATQFAMDDADEIGIEPVMNYLDGLNWPTGLAVLSAMRNVPVYQSVADIVGRCQDGVCFTAVYLAMMENFQRGYTKEEVTAANKKMANSLPDSVHSAWNGWLKEMGDA